MILMPQPMSLQMMARIEKSTMKKEAIRKARIMMKNLLVLIAIVLCSECLFLLLAQDQRTTSTRDQNQTPSLSVMKLMLASSEVSPEQNKALQDAA